MQSFEIWYPNQQKHDLLLLMFFFSRFPVVDSTVNYVNQPKCLQSLWWTRCFYSTRAGKVESLRLPVVVRPLQTPPTFQWGCQIHPPQTQLIQLKQPWIIVPTPRQVCFIIRRNAERNFFWTNMNAKLCHYQRLAFLFTVVRQIFLRNFENSICERSSIAALMFKQNLHLLSQSPIHHQLMSYPATLEGGSTIAHARQRKIIYNVPIV